MPPRRDELPVVAHAYRLAGDITTAVQRMPRGLRAVLGSELLRETVGLCADLQQAALHRRRTDVLERSDVHLTRVRVLARLAYDQRALSPGMYEAMTEQAEQVGKMLGGWLRAERGSHRGFNDAGAP